VIGFLHTYSFTPKFNYLCEERLKLYHLPCQRNASVNHFPLY
jgi:hypothetical protein